MRKNIIRPFVSKTLSLIMLLSMITAVSAGIAMVPVRKTEAATNSSTDNYTAITFEQKEKEFLSSPMRTVDPKIRDRYLLSRWLERFDTEGEIP